MSVRFMYVIRLRNLKGKRVGLHGMLGGWMRESWTRN